MVDILVCMGIAALTPLIKETDLEPMIVFTTRCESIKLGSDLTVIDLCILQVVDLSHTTDGDTDAVFQRYISRIKCRGRSDSGVGTLHMAGSHICPQSLGTALVAEAAFLHLITAGDAYPTIILRCAAVIAEITAD